MKICLVLGAGASLANAFYFRGQSTRSGLTGEKELIQHLIDDEYRGAAAMMRGAFSFFVPGWISEARAAHLPEPPD
jgi:hypothetical protein